MTSRSLALYGLAGLASGILAWVALTFDVGTSGTHVRRADLGSAVRDGTAAPLSWNAGVMRAAPSVVSVYASSSRARRGSLSRLDTRQGSGVVVAADGLIVTNRHLIEGAEVINVALPDGRLLIGRSIGEDAETDLALVRVPTGNLPALTLDAVAPPRVGDVVLAIGNPFGVGQTVTQGIVSATERRVVGGSVWQDFIQIDAAINPGNSGGALINTLGELVGVNTAVFLDAAGSAAPGGRAAARGIGYAIPARVLAHVVPQLLEHAHVRRGWLGIDSDDPPVTPLADGTLASPRGALVTRVARDAPGTAAGLLQGDIVVELDGRPIADARALMLGVAELPALQAIDLSVLRDGRPVTLSAIPGVRPRPVPLTDPPPDPSPDPSPDAGEPGAQPRDRADG